MSINTARNLSTLSYKPYNLFSWCKSGDYEIDIYSVRLRLAFLIPEFLPIRGKRARLYHHGISPFCIVCNGIGHIKAECMNEPVPWNEYVESLKSTGIPRPLFEPLIENSNNTPNHSLVNQNFASSTPRIDQDAVLRAQFCQLMEEALGVAPLLDNSQEQNQNNANPNVNPNADPNEVVELAQINPNPARGRPRGRPPLVINPNSRGNTRGRATGRPQIQYQNPIYVADPSLNIPQRGRSNRGRGRGRGYQGQNNQRAHNRGGYSFRNRN